MTWKVQNLPAYVIVFPVKATALQCCNRPTNGGHGWKAGGTAKGKAATKAARILISALDPVDASECPLCGVVYIIR